MSWSSAPCQPQACRKCSLPAVRPTLTPSTFTGTSFVWLLPSWMQASPTLNFTPAKVCLPVGSLVRLLPAKASPWKLSASLVLAWGVRSIKVGPESAGAGAAARTPANPKRQIAKVRERDTGHLLVGTGLARGDIFGV